MEGEILERRSRRAARYGQDRRGAPAPEHSAKMAQGTITKLTPDRGLGYILPAGAGAEWQTVVFHRADMAGTEPWNVLSYEELQVGQQVAYDLGADERQGSPRASNVQPLTPQTLCCAPDPGVLQNTVSPMRLGVPLTQPQTLAIMVSERTAIADRAAQTAALRT